MTNQILGLCRFHVNCPKCGKHIGTFDLFPGTLFMSYQIVCMSCAEPKDGDFES